MTTYLIVDMANLQKDSFYTYALLDPRVIDVTFGSQPFYIGKGKNRRAMSHLLGYKSAGSNPIKEAKIQQIRADGFEPKAVILNYHELETNAFLEEESLIKGLGRKQLGTGPLTNMSDGGDGGSSGVPCSEEKKLAISRANSGRVRTDQTRQKLREAREKQPSWSKGKTFSDKHKKALSLAHQGKTQSPEFIEKRIAPLRGRKRCPELMARIVKTRQENRKMKESEQ